MRLPWLWVMSRELRVKAFWFFHQTAPANLTDGFGIFIRAVRFVRYIHAMILLHVCTNFIVSGDRKKVVNASRIVVTTSKKVVSTGWKKFIFGVAMACSTWIFVRSVAWKLYKIPSLDFATATPKINFFHLHDWILYTTDFSFVNWLHRLSW